MDLYPAPSLAIRTITTTMMTRLPSKHASRARATLQPQCISMIRHVMEEVGACHCQTRRALPAIQERLLPQVAELDDALDEYKECCEIGLTPDPAALRMAVIDSDIEIATSLGAEVYEVMQQTAHRASEFVGTPSPCHLIERDQAKRDLRRLLDLDHWMKDACERLHVIKDRQEKGAGRVGNQPARKPKTHAIDRGQGMQTKKRRVADVFDSDDDFENLQESDTKRQKTSSSHAQSHSPVLDLCSDSDVETLMLVGTRRPSSKELQQPGTSVTYMKQSRSVDSALALHVASSILRTMGHHPELPPLNHDLEDVLSGKQLKKNRQWDAGVAMAQDNTVKDAVSWWKAHG